MKKYMLVASFSTLSLLFAEMANPFSISQHLEQLDKDKDALLMSLVETNNTSNKLERQKRLAKIKKIRNERVEALRIKKHKEVLLRQSQKKIPNKKHIANHATLESKKALTKKVPSPKVQDKPIHPKEVSLTKQEALEQAYLDAIKEVNK